MASGDSTQGCIEPAAKKSSWAHTGGGRESMVPLCSEVPKEKEWTVGGTTQLPSSALQSRDAAELRSWELAGRERGSVIHREM